MASSKLQAAIDRANEKGFTIEICGRYTGGIVRPQTRVIITQRDTGIRITDMFFVGNHGDMISYINKHVSRDDFGKLKDNQKDNIICGLLEEVELAFEERPDNGTTRWACDKLDAINRIREILEEKL